MLIDQSKCIRCGRCIPYCPMNCIVRGEDRAVNIVLTECAECEVCKNSKICPVDAFVMPDLKYPRVLRQQFSNPLVPHPNTGVPGRGTEEMKTNDVTGRFKRGKAGIAIEMGRPGTGTWFKDVEKVTMALAPYIEAFEPENPVTSLMEDQKTGKLKEEALSVKSISAIIEFEVRNEEITKILNVLHDVQYEIDTVFSLDIACRLEEDESSPAIALVRDAGYTLSLNGKTNVGLGRPLYKEGEN